MKVQFASDLIKITFEENEQFSTHSLIMYGEVLNKGFAATVSTMSWLSPNKGAEVTPHDKDMICALISDYNKSSGFHIELVEG